MIVRNICAALGLACLIAIANQSAIAAEWDDDNGCPPPHADYRKPKAVWGGFGYQVNACPGDKIEVAAALSVSAGKPQGMIRIPQTLPWNVDLSGLAPDQLAYLREHCEADLPCAAHFRITVPKIGQTERVCKESGRVTSCQEETKDPNRVFATLDGFRP
jgi:hypothetical protein